MILLARRALARFMFLIVAGAVSPSYALDYELQTLADETLLNGPWSVAFLPDGTLLVTELAGRLHHLSADGEPLQEVRNVPDVFFGGQGGLFDVLPHPDFAANRRIYLSYAEGPPGRNGTVVAAARLADGRLEALRVVHRVAPRKNTPVHYGGRLAFLPDGSLLLTTGDGFDLREAAQDLGSELGKVLRLAGNGDPHEGNPFPAHPTVFTYGHRNPQGLVVASDGTIYMHEHGPRGGDEVNVLQAGRNYGWPAVTFGLDYTGAQVSPYTEWEGMAPPAYVWTPSIAPSGLAIYEGDLFPAWRGQLFVGALVNKDVRRLTVAGGVVTDEVVMFQELEARVRDVRAGPDGALYLLTENPGRLIRVVPAQ